MAEFDSIGFAGSQISERLDKLIAVIDGATSSLITVNVSEAEDYAPGARIRRLRQVGGKRYEQFPGTRGVLVSALGLPDDWAAGTYLVRIRPNQSYDLDTWDWHDWRKL